LAFLTQFSTLLAKEVMRKWLGSTSKLLAFRLKSPLGFR
jgi:hypothetical protein